MICDPRYELEKLLAMRGKMIRIEQPDGTGGAGVLAGVQLEDGTPRRISLLLDYGYSFELREGSMVRLWEEQRLQERHGAPAED